MLDVVGKSVEPKTPPAPILRAFETSLPMAASVPIPKFASIRGDLRANFGIDKDTSKYLILVPLLNPKFATVHAEKSCELRVRGTGHSGHSSLSRGRLACVREPQARRTLRRGRFSEAIAG